MIFNEDININNLKFSYEEKIILDNINLSVKSNSIFGIKGKSGSGKTTLLNLIIGFLNPEEGNIKIGKKSILDNVKKWQESISYVPQKIFLIDDSLKKNIAFEYKDVKIDDKRLIKSVEIAQLKEHFGKNLDLKYCCWRNWKKDFSRPNTKNGNCKSTLLKSLKYSFR